MTMNPHNKNYNTTPAVSEVQANLLALASHAAYEYGDNRLVKDSSDQAMFQNDYKVVRELTDPDMFSVVDVSQFRIEDDPVSFLGDEHLGGPIFIQGDLIYLKK